VVHTLRFSQLFYTYNYSFLFVLTLLVQSCVGQYFNKEIYDDDDDDDDDDKAVVHFFVLLYGMKSLFNASNLGVSCNAVVEFLFGKLIH